MSRIDPELLEELVPIIRAVVQNTVPQAAGKARTTKIVSGTVEGVDTSLDTLYVRMDLEAMGSDPEESDNYGYPGVVPAFRMGSTFTGEQVRVSFDGSAGASAMQTSAEKKIILPYGAEDDARVVMDGDGGFVAWISSFGDLIIDPIGGIRFRDTNGSLATVLDQQGYTIRQPSSGEVQAQVLGDSIRVTDPNGSDHILLSSSSADTHNPPTWNADPEVSPGSSLVAPGAELFSADDLVLAHVAAWHPTSDLSSATTTPPTGFTEELDTANLQNGSTLLVSAASDRPAAGTAASFTASSSAFAAAVGTQVILQSGSDHGETAPSVRSKSSLFVENSGLIVPVSMSAPAGVADGDVLVAFVSLGNLNGSVPNGWTTPDGWKFLGADFTINNGSTVATGAWYKFATASEPSTYDIEVSFADNGIKTLHGTVFAIQDVHHFPGGAVIRVGDHPLSRVLDQYEVTTTGGEREVTFPNIPQTYENLRLVIAADSNTGTDQKRDVELRFNGDTGNNYFSRHVLTEGGTLTTGTRFPGDSVFLGRIDGATVGSSFDGIVEVLGYADPAHRVSAIAETMAVHDAGLRLVSYDIRGVWDADNVTSLTIRTSNSATKFRVGSKFTLYGW